MSQSFIENYNITLIGYGDSTLSLLSLYIDMAVDILK